MRCWREESLVTWRKKCGKIGADEYRDGEGCGTENDYQVRKIRQQYLIVCGDKF